MATSPAGTISGAARRRRIAARTRLDFWFDAVLLVGYTLAYSYGFTGIGIHEWLGLGSPALALDRQDRPPAPDPAAAMRSARHPRPAASSGRRRAPAARFARHLAVVALLVAAVTAAGLAWGHFDPGPLPRRGPVGTAQFVVRGQPAKRAPRGLKIRPGVRLGNTGPENLGLTSMFQAVNLPVLRDTVEIEAGAAAAVMILEIGRRKLRRARRATR